MAKDYQSPSSEDKKQGYGYGKRPLWQWILMYIIVAGVAYGLVYFIFFTNKNGAYNNNSQYPTTNTQNENTQTLGYGGELTNYKDEPISIAIGSLPVKIFKKEYPAVDEIPTPAMAAECNIKFPSGYLENLAGKFTGVNRTVYTVVYTAKPYQNSNYQVMVMANKPNYGTVEKAKLDFFACGVGYLTPLKVNKDWIVLARGCGGVDEGCGVIQESIDKNIQFQAKAEATAKNYMIQNMNIQILKEGTGPEAKTGDKVTVHYVGTLENGKKFDSSVDRGTPFQFTLGENRVIKGWELGVAGMKVGEKRKLTIPSELGYGANGYPPAIPQNATLIFEIDLLKIN